MKKSMAAAVAAVVAGAGLVAPSSAAEDVPERCPYTGCLSTTIVAQGPTQLQRKQRANVAFTVKSPGNAQPSGFVRIRVRQETRAKKYRRGYLVEYRGGRERFDGHRVTRVGRYGVEAIFIPDADGPYEHSSDAYRLRVTRR